jgi:CDP-diacylglycerol--glycerol-3-phosphate 3-phosphatidyltransferase
MNDKQETQVKSNWSLEMYLRKVFKNVIDPIARGLLRLGITPNTITAIGFLLSTVAAVFASQGKFTIAGLILLVAAPLDVVDGSMARLIGTPSAYGSLIDSVTDRYSELVVFGGMMFYFVNTQNTVAAMLVYIAAAGSVLVSYVKARAEGLNLSAKVGLLTRVERLIILINCLIINIPMVALWIIAVLANFTAIQRLLYVRRQVLK